MLRTAQQNKQLFAILNKLGYDTEDRAELVYNATAGRTKSSAELHYYECQRLIQSLSGEANAEAIKADKMRKKILSICHEMGWANNNAIDWPRLNNWLTKYGYLHKALTNYTVKELPKLVTQFENLLKSYYAARKS
jgi:hypothetical protein